jgi:hypothetical protein
VDTFTTYGLAILQFILIVFLGLLFIGLWKRKAFARWGTLIFFVLILVGYNIFVVLLGSSAINMIKFLIVNGVSVFFIYQLAFNDNLNKFFR